jgi:hypothetical protein
MYAATMCIFHDKALQTLPTRQNVPYHYLAASFPSIIFIQTKSQLAILLEAALEYLGS